MNIAQQEEQLAAEHERPADDEREKKDEGGGGKAQPGAPLARHQREEVGRPRHEHSKRRESAQDHHETSPDDLTLGPRTQEEISPGFRHPRGFS